MATAIQFLRSSTPGLRPDPDSLMDGMPMVNTAVSESGLFFKLSDNSIGKFGPTHVGPDAPNSSPALTLGNSVGEQWLDTSLSTAILKTWDGDKWVPSGTDLSGLTATHVLFSDRSGAVIGDDNFTFDSLTKVFTAAKSTNLGSASTDRLTVAATSYFTADVKVGGLRINPNILLETGGNIRLGGTLSANTGVKVGTNDEVVISGSTGDITTVGNVSAEYLIGDGSKITNLNIPGSMTFQGSIDATATGPGAPAAVTGDFYLNTVDGTVVASFIGAAGNTIEAGQFIYYTVDDEWVVSNSGTLYVSVDADQNVRGTKTWFDDQIFKQSIEVQGNFVIDGDTVIGTPLTTGDSLEVNAETTFNSDVTCEVDLGVKGNLTVESQSILKDNTVVADGKITTLGGDLTVKQAATLNDTLDVAGDATFAKIQATNYFIDSLPPLPL